MFYYDQYLNNTETSMELYAQSSVKNDFTPIAKSVMSVHDSYGGSVSINWNQGSGNLIDSFFEGVAKGVQSFDTMKAQWTSTAADLTGAAPGSTVDNKKNEAQFEAQKKVYSASSFYQKYDGSEVSFTLQPEFVFVTMNSSSLAINKAENLIAYLSPRQRGGGLGVKKKKGKDKNAEKAKSVRVYYEGPPNDYYTKNEGFGPENYAGTFKLRLGSLAEFKYLVVSSFDINVSTQLVYLSSGKSTPLWVKVKISMKPAGRVTAVELYNMLTGVVVETKKAPISSNKKNEI